MDTAAWNLLTSLFYVVVLALVLLEDIIISAKWTKWMGEIMCLFNVSVCLFVCSVCLCVLGLLSSRLFQGGGIKKLSGGTIEWPKATSPGAKRLAGEGFGEGVSPSPWMGVRACHSRENFEIWDAIWCNLVNFGNKLTVLQQLQNRYSPLRGSWWSFSRGELICFKRSTPVAG